MSSEITLLLTDRTTCLTAGPRRHARKVPQGAEARRQADLHLRPAGCSLRHGERVELVHPASHAPFELRYPEESQAAGASYSFLFMQANGEQLSKITSLIESGLIRQVVDKILLVRSDPGGFALHRNGTFNAQSEGT
jgi:hypothetical protein